MRNPLTRYAQRAFRGLRLVLVVSVLLRLLLFCLPMVLQAFIDDAHVSMRAVALVPALFLLLCGVEGLTWQRISREESGSDDAEGPSEG